MGSSTSQEQKERKVATRSKVESASASIDYSFWDSESKNETRIREFMVFRGPQGASIYLGRRRIRYTPNESISQVALAAALPFLTSEEVHALLGYSSNRKPTITRQLTEPYSAQCGSHDWKMWHYSDDRIKNMVFVIE